MARIVGQNDGQFADALGQFAVELGKHARARRVLPAFDTRLLILGAMSNGFVSAAATAEGQQAADVPPAATALLQPQALASN